MKKILAWIGWIVAAVLALFHFRRADVAVVPGKVEKPKDIQQDMTETLTTDEIKSIMDHLRGTP